MKETLQTYIDWLGKTGVIAIALITLFLFWNLTTDYFETPKFLALVLFTAIFLVIYVLNFLISGKVIFTRTPFDIPLLIILFGAVVSTFLSPSQNVAIFGNTARVHGGLMSIVVYILFYFLLVSHLKKASTILQLLYALISGSALLSVLAILSYFGIKWLPFTWTSGLNFTPAGSIFSLLAVLIMLLPFVIIQIVKTKNILVQGIYTAALALFLITIALTATLTTYIAALAILVLTLISLRKHINLQKNLPLLAAPLFIALAVFALSQIPPVGANKNPLYTLYQSYQREIQLPFEISWKVSVSAFRDSPIIGTGPATNLFNFTTYKPASMNASQFWNLRFDTPFNEYLGFLGTLGGVGFLGLVALTIVYLSLSFQIILSKTISDELDILNKGAALAGLAFFILLLFHFSSLVLWVIGLIILACFTTLNKNLVQNSTLKTESLSPSSFKLNLDALPMIIMLVVIVLIGSGFVFVGQFALADYHHRKALDAVVANQALLAYNELIEAEKINPRIDLYRSDLAQTNFALANAIAASKGPTESSPSGSLTDADKTNIQQFLSQAIAEGRNAVALSPRNVINWEILAAIYKQISGVAQNATTFALDSYGRAIALDPANPMLRLEVGGIYLTAKNYDLAVRFFTDAINLKPDYNNAYYNLAVALRDKGDLKSAQNAAERLMSLLTPDSKDYKTAADLLTAIKEAAPAPTPTAGQSALQKEQLPKVLDLPKPTNIASPEAVQR